MKDVHICLIRVLHVHVADQFTLSYPHISTVWKEERMFQGFFKIEMPFCHQVCDIMCIRPSGENAAD